MKPESSDTWPSEDNSSPRNSTGSRDSKRSSSSFLLAKTEGEDAVIDENVNDVVAPPDSNEHVSSHRWAQPSTSAPSLNESGILSKTKHNLIGNLSETESSRCQSYSGVIKMKEHSNDVYTSNSPEESAFREQHHTEDSEANKERILKRVLFTEKDLSANFGNEIYEFCRANQTEDGRQLAYKISLENPACLFMLQSKNCLVLDSKLFNLDSKSEAAKKFLTSFLRFLVSAKEAGRQPHIVVERMELKTTEDKISKQKDSSQLLKFTILEVILAVALFQLNVELDPLLREYSELSADPLDDVTSSTFKRIKKMKEACQELKSKTKSVKKLLVEIRDNEEALFELDLVFRFPQVNDDGLSKKPSEHEEKIAEEVKSMLRYFIHRAGTVKLEAKRLFEHACNFESSVKLTVAIVNYKAGTLRLKLSIGSLIAACGAFIAAVLEMNMKSEPEVLRWVFIIFLCLNVVLLLLAHRLYWKKRKCKPAGFCHKCLPSETSEGKEESKDTSLECKGEAETATQETADVEAKNIEAKIPKLPPLPRKTDFRPLAQRLGQIIAAATAIVLQICKTQPKNALHLLRPLNLFSTWCQAKVAAMSRANPKERTNKVQPTQPTNVLLAQKNQETSNRAVNVDLNQSSEIFPVAEIDSSFSDCAKDDETINISVESLENDSVLENENVTHLAVVTLGEPSESPMENQMLNVFLTRVNEEHEDSAVSRTQQHLKSYRIQSIPSDRPIELPEVLVGVGIDEELLPKQQAEIKMLLCEYQDCFATDLGQLEQTNLLEHEIHLKKDVAPCYIRGFRRFSQEELNFLESEIAKQLSSGIIEESDGEWASPVTLAKKKDGSFRMCIAYVSLNKKIERESFPLPLITTLLDRMSNKLYFSSLDGFSAYYTVRLSQKSKKYTQFITPFGCYRYRVLPFGVKTAPNCFSRFMAALLRGLDNSYCSFYLDDVAVYSKSWDGHLSHLKKTMDRIRISKMKLKAKKCTFDSKRLHFLGHVVSENGIEVQKEKINAILDWPIPKTPKEIRRFLGVVNYYRHFIPQCSNVCVPLTELTKKKTKFEWNKQTQLAFDALKRLLTEAPVLVSPRLDSPFRLDTDVSAFAIGSLLSQDEHPIAYFSKSLDKCQRNYSVSERECLSIVLSATNFRHYILGSKVTVYTDHASAAAMLTKPTQIGRLARWVMVMSEFDIVYKHRSGAKNNNADPLSRRPDFENLAEEEDLRTKEEDHCPNDPKSLSSLSNSTEPGQPVVLQSRWTSAIQDPTYVKIISYLRDGFADADTPAGRRKIRRLSERYVLQDNRLYYLDLDGSLKICVHKDDIQGLLTEFHEQSGHFGRDITALGLRRHFFWPSMSKDIWEHVKSCQECQHFTQNSRAAPLSPLQPVAPFDIIELDWITRLPRSSSGNTAIISGTDCFSKWIEAKAFPTANAENSIAFLIHRFCVRFGTPCVVLTDNGLHFRAEFEETVLRLQISLKHSSLAHPQTQGQDERSNALLMGRIRRLIGQDERSWDKYIGQSVLALNSMRSPTRKYSALECVLGVTPRRPVELALVQEDLGEDSAVEAISRVTTINMEDRLQHLSMIRDEALVESENRAEIMKRRYDKKIRRKLDIEVGDAVLVRESVKQGKLKKRWAGPGYVTWKGDHNAAKVFLDGTEGTYSVDRLRHYYWR